MLNKTTSFIFNKYGEIVQDLNKKSLSKVHRTTLRLKEKSFTQFYVYNCDIYIKVTSGIVMLVVSSDPNNKLYERFVIHRSVKIKKGIKFNFLPISNQARVEIEVETKGVQTMENTYFSLPIAYEPIVPSFQINEILGYYYQVRNPNYAFEGESHSFWELTFIDHGELQTIVDDDIYTLEPLDFILYAPNQFHSQKALKNDSCSYLTILFDMEIPDSFLITNRVYHAHREIHQVINNFIKVSENNKLYDNELMLTYLKEFIIKTLQYDFMDNSPVASSPMQQRMENDLLNEIIDYINNNLYQQLNIEEICESFSISRSSLQALFNNNLGTPPKKYISDLKLARSKILIKDSQYTISQISTMLGFSSIHYFSRLFKQRFGITPSDYAKTIYN